MTRQTETRTTARRKIPMLVWIVLAILVGWLVVALIQSPTKDATPITDDLPGAVQNPAYMPPAPAGPEAPATPPNVSPGPVPAVE